MNYDYIMGAVVKRFLRGKRGDKRILWILTNKLYGLCADRGIVYRWYGFVWDFEIQSWGHVPPHLPPQYAGHSACTIIERPLKTKLIS